MVESGQEDFVCSLERFLVFRFVNSTLEYWSSDQRFFSRYAMDYDTIACLHSPKPNVNINRHCMCFAEATPKVS